MAPNSQQTALIDCCSQENFEKNAFRTELIMLTQLALLNETSGLSFALFAIGTETKKIWKGAHQHSSALLDLIMLAT